MRLINFMELKYRHLSSVFTINCEINKKYELKFNTMNQCLFDKRMNESVD